MSLQQEKVRKAKARRTELKSRGLCIKCGQPATGARVTCLSCRCAKYGIKPEDYWQLYNNQQGLCICGEPLLTDIVIDHDHKTGKVRGLLHSFCNYIILGSIEHNNAITIPKLPLSDLIPRFKAYLYNNKV